MTAIFETEFLVPASLQDSFLKSAQAEVATSRSDESSVVLRKLLIGANFETRYVIRRRFADAAGRAAYLDKAAAASPTASLDPSIRSTHRFLDEAAGSPALKTEAPVISILTWSVAPGREAEADEALVAGTEVRRLLDIEAHLYVANYAGPQTGLRLFEIHAASHSKLASDAAEVVANRRRLGGVGPIPKAIQSGAIAMIDAVISTLES